MSLIDLSLAQAYLDLLDDSSVQTLDDVMKRLHITETEAVAIHDLIYRIWRTIEKSELLGKIRVTEVGLRAVGEQIEALVSEELISSDPEQRKLARAALKNMMSIQSDWIDRKARLTNPDENLIRVVLDALFHVLTSIDPMVAIRVREETVKRFPEALGMIPYYAGGESAQRSESF